MDRHLAFAHNEDALAVFCLIYVKHRAVRIEVRLIHSVSDGRAGLRRSSFLSGLACLYGLSFLSGLCRLSGLRLCCGAGIGRRS